MGAAWAWTKSKQGGSHHEEKRRELGASSVRIWPSSAMRANHGEQRSAQKVERGGRKEEQERAARGAGARASRWEMEQGPGSYTRERWTGHRALRGGDKLREEKSREKAAGSSSRS
jgi:hypothetical protein